MDAITKIPRLLLRLVAGIVVCSTLAGCGGLFGPSQQPAPPPPPPVQPQTPPPPPPPKPADNTVALLIPLGGPFRQFGGKVEQGAMAAKADLAKAGTTIDVIVIDATQPGWVERLRALPPTVSLVGGPMHRLTLKELETAGMLRSRVFLAFMQTLGDSREGIDAWRFFPSPEDEVDALLRLALSDYGINQFGILRPGDRYGQFMSEIFAQGVARLGGQVTATGVYAPQDATTWDATVMDMLKTGNGRLGFGAVFMPDDWARADKVLANFFRNKIEDLLILGTQTWTEALYRAAANKTPINIQNYRLAVCPGAWWPDNQGRATQDLVAAMRGAGNEHPDLWEAVGYDFVRMAARLGPLPQGLQPQETSARLAQAASGMEFSMAPLSYTPDGKAHVAMYLFRPSVAGPVLLDPEGFRQRLNAIRQKALENPTPTSEQYYAPLPAQQPVPGQPEGQPGQQPAPQPGQQPGQQPAPQPAQPTTQTTPAQPTTQTSPAQPTTQTTPGQPGPYVPAPSHRQSYTTPAQQ
jgi:ABC-type branched-subunit amino acid transport system substrate-binding protein